MLTFRLLHRSVRTASIFVVSLCLLLAVSYYIVLPQITLVTYNDSTYKADTLQHYSTSLTAAVTSLEAERIQLLQPVALPAFTKALAAKTPTASLQQFFTSSTALIDRFTLSGVPLVRITAMNAVHTNEWTITMNGVLHNTADRSGIVLAEFASALRALPQVQSVETVGSTKIRTAEGGIELPFTLRVTIAPYES